MNPHAINVACGSNAVTHHGRHPPWSCAWDSNPEHLAFEASTSAVGSAQVGVEGGSRTLKSFLTQASRTCEFTVSPLRLGRSGEIRTLTGVLLRHVSLPLEYRPMVQVERVELSLAASEAGVLPLDDT